MEKVIPGIRGMNDVLPEAMPYWTFLEKTCISLMRRYDYHGIRFPMLEYTELFQRSMGEGTDVIDKEMYTFLDRNGESVSLRPEGTAGCVRAGIAHSLFYNQVRKLWYLGPMFRYERPQKGRYRQFMQFGVEAFGLSGPMIEAELIYMGARLWQALGLDAYVRLELNTLGTPACQARYRERLVAYMHQHNEGLDEDSRRRLQSNPLRILDSKNPAMQSIIAGAPQLIDDLDPSALAHFEQLCGMLSEYGIPYRINHRLVRGLDYYTHTIFEWVTDALGAQGAVAAGGRYDGLVAQLGGGAIPAVGLAAGLERIVLLLQTLEQRVEVPDLYVLFSDVSAVPLGLIMAEKLRDRLPCLSVSVDLTGSRLKAQLRHADKSGARWAVILSPDSKQADTLLLKDLRANRPQQNLSMDALVQFLHGRCEL